MPVRNSRSARMLRLRKAKIFFRTVGKVVAGFWAMFAVGATITHYNEWSVSTAATSTIFLLGTMFSAISGWREFKIEAHLEGMRELGRLAGSIGLPPDFYKKDGTNADVADEVAILQGWNFGWKEFQALSKDQQALYAEQNRLKGY